MSSSEELTVQWNLLVVFYSLVLSFVGCSAGISALLHARWRVKCTDEMEYGLLMRYPLSVCAYNVAFGGVFVLHFIGMAALSLEQQSDDLIFGTVSVPVSMWFKPWITLASLAACLVCLWIGIGIASKDCFAGEDRLDILEDICGSAQSAEHKRRVFVCAYFGRLQDVLGGASIAAFGVITMHYLGLAAADGDFEIHWDVPWLAASCVIAVVICSVGFWILFRLLLWRASVWWLRPVSAAILAGAVALFHYSSALFAAKYYYVDKGFAAGDASVDGEFSISAEFQLGICMLVFWMALITERSINTDMQVVLADSDASTLQKLVPEKTDFSRI